MFDDSSSLCAERLNVRSPEERWNRSTRNYEPTKSKEIDWFQICFGMTITKIRKACATDKSTPGLNYLSKAWHMYQWRNLTCLVCSVVYFWNPFSVCFVRLSFWKCLNSLTQATFVDWSPIIVHLSHNVLRILTQTKIV